MQLARYRSFIVAFRNIIKPVVPVSNNLVSLRKLLSYDKQQNARLFLISLSIFSFRTKKQGLNEEETSEKEIEKVVAKADELYKHNRYHEVRELLESYKDSSEVEILWRLSRALYNMSQEIATSPEEKKALIFEAFDVISRSLALDETHFANHKWMSVLLDARTTYDGIKARILHLQSVKNHMMTAIHLNPKDATTLYMLGLWCYQIADMPWYQRRIAAAAFTAPPESTFEEALEYFTKAEETEPRFYSQNLLMLGKTYLKLKKEEKARYYLDLACNYPITTDDDHLANKEACELLKKLKGKKMFIL